MYRQIFQKNFDTFSKNIENTENFLTSLEKKGNFGKCFDKLCKKIKISETILTNFQKN